MRPHPLRARATEESSAPQGLVELSMKASRAAFYVALFTLTFEQTRPYEISISDLFFILASAAALPRLATLRLPLPSRSAAIPAGLLISAAGAFSLLNADLSDPDLFPSLVKLLVTFAVLPLLVTLHGQSVRMALLVFAAGVVMNCGIAVLEAVGFGLRERLELNPITEADLWGRHRGLASHANILGLAAAMGSLVVTSALISERRAFRRVLFGAALLGCGIAAALTTSRTALIALPLIGVLLVAQGGVRPFRLLVAVAVLMLGLGGVAYLLPEYSERITERFLTTGTENEGDNFRLDSFEVALSEIAQHPIVGAGVEKAGMAGLMFVPKTAAKYLSAHNSPLQFWYAFGLLGMAGWLMLFANTFWLLWRARRTTVNREYMDVYLCMVALLFIAGNLHPFLFVRFFYVPVYLASAAAAWTLYEARKQEASPPARSGLARPAPLTPQTLAHGGSRIR